jgi:hypothetical protein
MWWHEMKETLTDVPGFISGRLHRSLKADARFNFINVVECDCLAQLSRSISIRMRSLRTKAKPRALSSIRVKHEQIQLRSSVAACPTARTSIRVKEIR